MDTSHRNGPKQPGCCKPNRRQMVKGNKTYAENGLTSGTLPPQLQTIFGRSNALGHLGDQNCPLQDRLHHLNITERADAWNRRPVPNLICGMKPLFEHPSPFQAIVIRLDKRSPIHHPQSIKKATHPAAQLPKCTLSTETSIPDPANSLRDKTAPRCASQQAQV